MLSSCTTSCSRIYSEKPFFVNICKLKDLSLTGSSVLENMGEEHSFFSMEHSFESGVEHSSLELVA